jgi:hypothetical protein
LATIFACFEHAGLLYLVHFQAKVQATPLVNLAAGMGTAIGGIRPQNLPLIPPPPGGRRGKKWHLH